MYSRQDKVPVEILIVDDEPQAVKYFQKAFGSKYDVVTATSAEEAEEIVFSGAHNIGIVITDQRMPGRSGVSLLANIRRKRPEIVRMLTSAYSDLDSAIQAVNSGEISRYITKPWDLQSLGADIEQAATFYMLQREYEMLLSEKLGAVQRTLLRDRINSLAAISAALPQYRNAKATFYSYLKDALGEASMRPAVHKQWAAMRPEDHWRLPVDETHRLIAIASELSNPALAGAANRDDAQADIVSVISECAQALGSAHKMMAISVRCESNVVPVKGPEPVLRGIVERLMQPISQWAAPGTTVLVQVKNAKRDGEADGAAVTFEIRNFDAAKAAADCILHTPPLQAASKQSVEYLRAALAVGHLGGTLNSPPAQNGFKQIEMLLPQSASEPKADAYVPSDWIVDLNDDYEKWVLGAYDVAS